MSHHKPVVRNDIKLAMRIIECMDKRWGLWQEGGEAAQAEAERLAAAEQANGKAADEAGADAKPAAAADDKAAAAAQTEGDYAKLEETAFTRLTPSQCPPVKHKVSTSLNIKHYPLL